jgi:glycosyltransferase involved in cell wall biosynthesis
MKVLMITPSYFPIKGGAETIVHDISTRLNRIGIHTAVLTFNMDRKLNPYWYGKIEENDGVKVYKIPALNWFPLAHSDRITMGINLIPGRFRKILKEYDILHFHGGDLTFPLFSCGVKKPKIFHFHGLSSDFYKKYFISRLILKNIAHTYICLTNSMKKEIISLGIPEEKVKILPNGVDTNLFYPLGEKNENLILFVGRVCQEKGINTLLKALTYLKTPINLAIIGPQDWNPKHFNNTLELIKKENEKGKHKIAYLGAKNREEIIEWYRKASFLVLPSQKEGFPVVIIEALACETPVIATNIGGIPEILPDNECGILVPSNNPKKLAEAIQFLLDKKGIRIKFGRRGRIMVEDHFSMDVVVGKLCKIYDEVISKFSD